MVFKDLLSEIVSAAFEELGYARELGFVTVSNRPDLCQYQCSSAMAAAKQYKKAPIAIANEVVEILKKDSRFASVEAAMPGFININVSDKYICDMINRMAADERMLLPLMERKTIVVDYGGPNVAKPLHVGHLRSAIIGDTLCRIARFLGHNVIGDTHLGDWGLQMGMVIAGLEDRMPELPYFDPDYSGEYPPEPPFNVDDLEVIYPAASAQAKTDKDFAQRAADATVEQQEGRRGYRALWEHIHNVSVADLKKNYDILGVHFDKWLGESDAAPYVPQVVAILKDKGLLRESDGAMVVDVARPDDKEPIPPMIIVKSNGGDMYGSTDLGTILQRKQDWNPDEIWYLTDVRQVLHFKQVLRCAELAGMLGDTICHHIPFGTMNGKDGKPYKTRDGGVMRLADLINQVTENAYEKSSRSDVGMDEESVIAAARKTGVAALKVGDMINHRTKDYIFDMDRFLSTEGKTGPYLQYASVRIKSLLEKARESGLSFGEILPPASDIERGLMLSLLSVSDSLLRAFAEKAPNVVCEELFDIAGQLNRFYSENHVLNCPDEKRRASWLSLIDLTNRMLECLLDTLGVEVPDKM